MENLLTNKTASLTELRDPKKVIEKAGDKPVAILNRNQLEGYFVPASARVRKIPRISTSRAGAVSTLKRTVCGEGIDLLNRLEGLLCLGPGNRVRNLLRCPGPSPAVVFTKSAVLVFPAAATGAGIVASCRHVDALPDELLIRQYYPIVIGCRQMREC